MHGDLGILVTLTAGLTAALVLGYITQRLKLSPILGYLIAGFVIGPNSPGFVADLPAANQFAEIGVILLMFGVGLHFHLNDLLAVRSVAIPGAMTQIAVATLCGMVALMASGENWATGLVIGVAISVASTVVLIRVLDDNGVLQTEQGYIAVGWLIVEDLFTVFVLVMLPAIATIAAGGEQSVMGILKMLTLAILRVGFLGLLVLGAGRRIIPWILTLVARTRTRELFTLTVLVLALAIAVGSSFAFGVSMALGAFLAGMVVGQSEVSHQAAADALPMRDAFAVLFFVSVGMLFSPAAVREHPRMFLEFLAIILIAKPLAAIAIVWALGYSPRAALTIAVSLAQIGEFSFIVADLALRQNLITAEMRSLLVAGAIVSITLNPLLFRGIAPFESWLKRHPKLWRAINVRSESRLTPRTTGLRPVGLPEAEETRAVLIGYGPVGRTAAAILKDFGIKPVVIDLNVDTVKSLHSAGQDAIFGDASRREILEAAGIHQAKYLLITVPGIEIRTVAVIAARELNPELKVFVRARYLGERAWLEEIGVTDVCYEEAETALGLASMILKEVGADQERIRTELQRIRKSFAPRPAAEVESAMSPPAPVSSDGSTAP
jgi:monovalent cation:H+ antiporter-2, CPA2 family